MHLFVCVYVLVFICTFLCFYASVNCVCVSSYVIMELIDTEKDYVRDLGLVVEVCNLYTLSSWILNLVVAACSELRKVLFLAPSFCES